MVHFHARSDPDGVIHVSDDTLDYDPYDPQENDYEVPKVGSGQQITEQIVDVTYLEDDGQRLNSDHRDPPADKRASIYDSRHLPNEGVRSDDMNDGEQGIRPDPSMALSETSFVRVRADPSMTGSESALRAHPSILQSDDSMVRSNPSRVRSEDSMAFKETSDLPVINVETLEEPKENLEVPVIDVESVVKQNESKRAAIVSAKAMIMANRSQAVSPVLSVVSPKATNDRSSDVRSTPSHVESRNEPANVAGYTPARQRKPSSNVSTSKRRPESPRMQKSPPTPLAKPHQVHAITRSQSEEETLPVVEASLFVPDTQLIHDAVDGHGANHKAIVKVDADTLQRNGEKAEGAASSRNWIVSGIMNTLACRGPEPAGSSEPMGLVACGGITSREDVKDAFAQDNEDDANSVLGAKGFDDLASLPSLDDSIIHGDGDGDAESIASSKASRLSIRTDYMGAAVENKIKSLEMEKLQRGGELEAEGDDNGLCDQQITQLVKELQEASTSFGPYDIRCAHLSESIAEKYSERKVFRKAVEFQKTAVSIYSTKLGDHHESTMDAKGRLGKCLEDVEEYDDGIACFYEVLAMRRSLKGDRDPSTSDSLIQIANCLRKKGQYMQAIRELKRALKVYRETLGDSHPSVASTVDEIASLYVTLGDFDKSAAILEEVVKLKAATLGMENPQVARSLVELATSYECSEDFERAVKALKKAYKIYTDLDGFSCEQATSTLHRIALLYQASGDIHKAAIAYLGVLRGKKHLMGDDHLEVAETYYRLGVCLRETNQLDKALKCMKEALPILVGKGKNIHDVDMIAEVMHEMALLYKAKRQLGEAAKIFKQELTVRRKIGQPEYPCIAKTLNHLGVTEYEMKMHRKALKHLLEVLTIFQEKEEQGIDFAEALYNIGLVFEAVRNKERAYEAFLEAARVFKANGYANDHPHLVKAVNKVKRLAKR